MDRIGIRELRNEVSRVVRRARGGERIVITVDGVPAAQIGPLNDVAADRSLDDLIAAGLVLAPRVASAPRPAMPTRSPGGPTTTEVLRQDRDR
jgi:prevent-host-death family protein